MLFIKIISNVEKNITKEEIELMYKLYIKNEKNIILFLENLCKFRLFLDNSEEINNLLLEKLLLLVEKSNKYLGKILDIFENHIKNNSRTIQCYLFLIEIIGKSINGLNERIFNIFKDKHLLNLFENNFNLYMKKAKELLLKHNISFSSTNFLLYDFKRKINKFLKICIRLFKYYSLKIIVFF